MPVNATNGVDDSEEFDDCGYAQTHFQINLKDVEVEILGKDDIQLQPKSHNNIVAHSNLRKSRSVVEREISALDSIFEDFPDVKKEVISEIQKSDSNLCAMSFTEVPLVLKDGHYERIASSSNSASSSEVGNGKFLMYTFVCGGNSYNSGKASYTASTNGRWSKNSVAGGSDYPASGEDFVLQMTPSAFSRSSDTFSAQYDNSPIVGVSGSDFYRCDGGTNYVQYSVLDDPLGYRQNKNFTLTSYSTAWPSSNSRMIQSYYVHTWSQMTISVSVSFGSDGPGLTITPGIESKQWQVYDYVTFNF